MCITEGVGSLKIETLSMKKGIAFNSSSPGHTRPWGQRRLKSWICQKLENASPELSSSLHQGRRSNMNHRSRSPPKPYSNASLILEEPYRPPLPATTTTSSGNSYHQRTSPDSRRETRPAVRDVPRAIAPHWLWRADWKLAIGRA